MPARLLLPSHASQGRKRGLPGRRRRARAPAGEHFSMAELVARTGVRPATVRHYLRLGLLPPPIRVARNRFLYDRRHEQALHLVRLLRERRHLPLSDIGRILPQLVKLADEPAFRTEMWDEVVEAQLNAKEDPGRSPAARLLRAGMAAFSRRGFAEVSVDDVCRSAKLAKGSFYRHYRSKEDLFFATAMAAAAEASRSFSAEVGVGLSEEEAGLALGRALSPHLPLMLDLLALAAQHRPGHARVARAAFSDLRRVVRAHLLSPAEGADQRVLGAALATSIRSLVTEPDQAPSLLRAGLGS